MDRLNRLRINITYFKILSLKPSFYNFDSYTVFTRGDRRGDRSHDRSRRSVARPMAATIASCKHAIEQPNIFLSEHLGVYRPCLHR